MARDLSLPNGLVPYELFDAQLDCPIARLYAGVRLIIKAAVLAVLMIPQVVCDSQVPALETS